MRTGKNSKDSLKDILTRSEKWIVVSHVKPDGDTLGSASALVQIGISLGKEVKWWGRDPLPGRYEFLPCSDSYFAKQSISELDLEDGGLVVSVDVSSLDRGIDGMDLGELAVIDHHGDNSLFGSVNWVEGEASSVGEMIYSLSVSMGVALTRGMAEALYVAIITDTGNLSFSNVTGDTVRVVADLIDCGVRPPEISEKLYHRDTTERLRLWGRAFERAKWEASICYSYLYADDFRDTGTEHDDTESLINSLMRIKDTEIALLFVEDGSEVKVSLRSKGRISVQDIAHVWGGGGHICASGCRVEGKMEEVILNVIKSISPC